MWAVEKSRLMDEQEAFRIYVTDILKASCEGKTLTERWLDLVRGKPDFDPEAIVDHIVDGLTGQ